MADDKEVVKTVKDVKPKVMAKSFQMHVGVDLIGSKTSMAASKNIELEVTPIGIKMVSKSTKRVVVIPWPNVKGFELYPDAVA